MQTNALQRLYRPTRCLQSSVRTLEDICIEKDTTAVVERSGSDGVSLHVSVVVQSTSLFQLPGPTNAPSWCPRKVRASRPVSPSRGRRDHDQDHDHRDDVGDDGDDDDDGTG